MLVLFVYYRKEPEIKASSFSISLCMFAGSILFFWQPASPFPREWNSCQVCGKYVGCISSLLYYAGNRYRACYSIDEDATPLEGFHFLGNTGKLWTDKVMLLFSGAILLIKVLILTIWAILDTLLP